MFRMLQNVEFALRTLEFEAGCCPGELGAGSGCRLFSPAARAKKQPVWSTGQCRIVAEGFLYATPPRIGSTTEVICEAMKIHSSYRHLRVDWVGESATESITLYGIENEDSGTEQTLCPDCAQVRDALNVCRLGPESLRELFDTLRVIDPSEVKAKMEALRGLGVQMDIQDRSQLN